MPAGYLVGVLIKVYFPLVQQLGKAMPIKKGYKWSRESVEKRIAAGAGRPDNTPEVLWSKVDRKADDECWEWLGYRNEQGYGRTWIKDKGYYAHRVIFDLQNPGVIGLSAPRSRDETGFLLHTCDNPSCCNPKHLFVGTHADNMADKVSKGRSPDFKGTKGPRSKLSEHDVEMIRRLLNYNLSSSEIAAVFNVSKPTIKSIRQGRTY